MPTCCQMEDEFEKVRLSPKLTFSEAEADLHRLLQRTGIDVEKYLPNSGKATSTGAQQSGAQPSSGGDSTSSPAS